MATLRQIRKRIASVKSTQKITRAMKMVSAAKLRRAQENIIRARPYAFKLREVLARVSSIVDPNLHPLLAVRPPEKVAYVVITADRGLCGGFNNNIISTAEKRIKEDGFDQPGLICVGRKSYDYFKRREHRIISHHASIFNDLEYAHAQQITDAIVDLYIQEQLDKVILIHNEFKSAIQQNIITEQLLPMISESVKEGEDTKKQLDYIYEPEPLRILDTIVPLNIGMQVWRVLLESSAAEHGARMTAMENATVNAQDMISSLTLHYNRVRQAAITKELLEIVGGTEALQ